MTGPYASAAQFRAIRRELYEDGRSVWEFAHHTDPTRGGWAVPHPDAAPGSNHYLAVRRADPLEWARDLSAVDQAADTESAKDAVLHSPPEAFVSGPLERVALFLSEPVG